MSDPVTREPDELLLRQLVELLADALAPRLAALLENHAAAPPPDGLPSRKLLTIDELVALLPAGKKPQTWRNWLYQKTRFGQVPGCYRLGNRLFFNPDETLPWLLNPGTSADTAAGLDLSDKQSLHAQAMPHQPAQRPRRPEKP
jgi:hypothetical protein